MVPERNENIAGMAHGAHEHHALSGAPGEEAFTREVVLMADPALSRGLGLGEVEFRLQPDQRKVIGLGQQMLDPSVAGLGRAHHNDPKGVDARVRRWAPEFAAASAE
jgi:hypothetical protein